MVEAGPQDLADVPVPGHRMDAGKCRGWGVCSDQQIETRVKQVKCQSAVGLEMPANRLQGFSLQIDRQQVLEGTKGDENEAKTPAQIQLAHVLIDQAQTIPHARGKLRDLTSSCHQHSVRVVD